MAGIYNVFDDDDLPAFKVIIQADEFDYLVTSPATIVRREFDKRDFAGDVDLLHQIGHNHEAAIEYTNENRMLIFVSYIKLYAYKPDTFLDLVVINNALKRFLIDPYLHVCTRGFLYLTY